MFSFMRMGLLALGMATGATSLSAAGPMPPLSMADSSSPAAGVLLVQDGYSYRRHRRAWNNDGDFNDSVVQDDDDDDQWRDGRRHWRRNHHGDNFYRHRRGPQIYFDFEQPVRRYVEPRRHYRAQGLTRAHVRWCEDRYISYRAWDNTFQPNRGPRRECYSPYI